MKPHGRNADRSDGDFGAVARVRATAVGTAVTIALLAAAVATPARAQATEPFVQSEDAENGQTTENWRQGYLQATGIGTADPGDNPVQAEAMAVQAARVVAQSRLLKLISGVTIRSKNLVKNASLDKQLIATEAQGSLEGAVTVDKQVEWVSGSQYGSSKSYPKATVVMRVCLRNFARACQQHGGGGAGVYQQMQNVLNDQPDEAGAETADAAGRSARGQISGDLADAAEQATGVILNLRGAFQYTPDLTPVVKDADGKVVYAYDMIDRAAVMKNGPLQYVTDIQEATSLDQLGDHPYVVDVQNVTSDGTIIISNRDAAVLRAANGRSGLLDQAQVAVAQRG